jgi:hypothetical protein
MFIQDSKLAVAAGGDNADAAAMVRPVAIEMSIDGQCNNGARHVV